MGFWVQYHSLDLNDGYLPYDGKQGYRGRLGINTSRPEAHSAIGDTIFLIVGTGEPKQYILWACFKCDNIIPCRSRDYDWVVEGEGWTLAAANGRQRLLNKETGFQDFLHLWGSEGRLYFKDISNSPFVETLLKLSDKFKPNLQKIPVPDSTLGSKSLTTGHSSSAAASPTQKSDGTKSIEEGQLAGGSTIVSEGLSEHTVGNKASGAGFGTPEKNKEVEQAAVKAVRERYEKNGWIGHSVETENRGYDYIFRRGSEEQHVEIKGISGKIPSFIITAKEVRTAQEDPNFVIWVVTSAKTTKPDCVPYKGYDFLKKFSLIAKDYWARPKTR